MTHVKINRKPFEGNWNNLVGDIFTDLPDLFKKEFNNNGRKGFVPVNVKESDNGYKLEIAAPGFEKTDFKISLDQMMLTISADKKNDVKEENQKNIRTEFVTGSFKRSFTLDEKIDATAIEASYINGILTLNLPKKAEVKIQANYN